MVMIVLSRFLQGLGGGGLLPSMLKNLLVYSAYLSGLSMGSMYRELVQQAHLWGYIDTFRWFAAATFLLIPMLALLKKPKTAE